MLQEIYNELFDLRRRIIGLTREKRVSIADPDHLPLKSVDAIFVLRSDKIKSIVSKSQLTDRVDRHAETCRDLISLFDVKGDKRLLLNLVSLLNSLWVSNGQKEYDPLSVGSFLFGGFYKFECNHKELFTTLSLSGLTRSSRIFGNFFYFETDTVYISSTEKLDELLPSTTYVFISNEAINFLQTVGKAGATRIQIEEMEMQQREKREIPAAVASLASEKGKDISSNDKEEESIVTIQKESKERDFTFILIAVAIILFLILLIWLYFKSE